MFSSCHPCSTIFRRSIFTSSDHFFHPHPMYPPYSTLCAAAVSPAFFAAASSRLDWILSICLTFACENFNLYSTLGSITVLLRYAMPARLMRFLLSTAASSRTSASTASSIPAISPSPFCTIPRYRQYSSAPKLFIISSRPATAPHCPSGSHCLPYIPPPSVTAPFNESHLVLSTLHLMPVRPQKSNTPSTTFCIPLPVLWYRLISSANTVDMISTVLPFSPSYSNGVSDRFLTTSRSQSTTATKTKQLSIPPCGTTPLSQ